MKNIINLLFNDEDVNTFISKLEPIHLQQDYKQQAFLQLLNRSNKSIIELHEKGELKQYFLKIISNVKNDYFRHNKLVLTNNFNDVEDVGYSEQHIKTTEMYWYDKEILKHHLEIGAVKLSKKTKIPLSSIYKTINKIKTNIKNGKTEIIETTE